MRVPGFGVMPGFEMLCECQELNLGSFEEQSVPISIKVPLHLNIKAIFFLKNKKTKKVFDGLWRPLGAQRTTSLEPCPTSLFSVPL